MFLSPGRGVSCISTPAKGATARNLCSCRVGRSGNNSSAGKPGREGCLYLLECPSAEHFQHAKHFFTTNQNCFPKAPERQESPMLQCLIFIIWGGMDVIRNEMQAKIMVWWSKLQLITTIKNQSVCVLICKFSVHPPDSWTIILLRKKRNKGGIPWSKLLGRAILLFSFARLLIEDI